MKNTKNKQTNTCNKHINNKKKQEMEYKKHITRTRQTNKHNKNIRNGKQNNET